MFSDVLPELQARSNRYSPHSPASPVDTRFREIQEVNPPNTLPVTLQVRHPSYVTHLGQRDRRDDAR